jgi:hypothetical protein
MSESFVAWRGPSEIDGGPIMAYIVPESTNDKTGPMWQVHIIRDDMSPIEAIRTGADESICGTCPLRGIVQDDGSRAQRACYVVYAQGPQSAWKASVAKPTLPWDEVLKRIEGQPVRMGAYGDPAALPWNIVRDLYIAAGEWMCYTHRWMFMEGIDLARWRLLSMASVDSQWQGAIARADGWRTFRPDPEGHAQEGNEIVCPNESRGVQCIDCGLCKGATNGPKQVKSIVITGHGIGAKYLS